MRQKDTIDRNIIMFQSEKQIFKRKYLGTGFIPLITHFYKKNCKLKKNVMRRISLRDLHQNSFSSPTQWGRLEGNDSRISLNSPRSWELWMVLDSSLEIKRARDRWWINFVVDQRRVVVLLERLALSELAGQGLIHVSWGPYVGHMGKKGSQEPFLDLIKEDYLKES